MVWQGSAGNRRPYANLVAKGLPTAGRVSIPFQWWCRWWAHLEFTRINIGLTILRKKIEDLREADANVAKRCGVIASKAWVAGLADVSELDFSCVFLVSCPLDNLDIIRRIRSLDGREEMRGVEWVKRRTQADSCRAHSTC